MHILIVEDNDETAEFICRGLEEAGHSYHHDRDAKAGLISATTRDFDVIVFDRLLPGMDGKDAVRILRESGATTPILMLTALAGIDDRVEGLEAGADDYLVKPSPLPSCMPGSALGRRLPISEESTRLQVGDLLMDRTTQTVTRRATPELLPREYRILELLMQNEGQLVTRTMLLEKVWGFNFDPKTSLVQTTLAACAPRSTSRLLLNSFKPSGGQDMSSLPRVSLTQSTVFRRTLVAGFLSLCLVIVFMWLVFAVYVWHTEQSMRTTITEVVEDFEAVYEDDELPRSSKKLPSMRDSLGCRLVI